MSPELPVLVCPSCGRATKALPHGPFVNCDWCVCDGRPLPFCIWPTHGHRLLAEGRDELIGALLDRNVAEAAAAYEDAQTQAWHALADSLANRRSFLNGVRCQAHHRAPCPECGLHQEG